MIQSAFDRFTRILSSGAVYEALKEKIGIAPEDFENRENSSNFILRYLSEFLLK